MIITNEIYFMFKFKIILKKFETYDHHRRLTHKHVQLSRRINRSLASSILLLHSDVMLSRPFSPPFFPYIHM